MKSALWIALLISAGACFNMGKRSRENESSSRQVRCFYCDDSVKFKDLKSHTENHHGKQPARVKGVPSLAEFFASKNAKKIKKNEVQPPTQVQPELRPTQVQPELPPPTPQIHPPKSEGIMSQLSDLIFTLLQFISPFKEATRSLERSAAKIENSILEKTTAVDNQRQQFKTIHSFQQKHKSDGLIVSNTGRYAYAQCTTCMRFEDQIKNVPYFDGDWSSHGKKLTTNRERQWDRHVKSHMHKAAVDIQKSRKFGSMFTREAQKIKSITLNFFRTAYALVLAYVPYRQFRLIHAALSLCGFPIGNQNHTRFAAAFAVDTFYDVFFRKLSKFVCSMNPCTGRPRQIWTSADKGTEINQRQVINLTIYDSDGRSINIHLTAHLINEIYLDNDEAEETTAKALLEHHYHQLSKLGLTRSDITNVWIGDVTDKEACYRRMGELAQEKNQGFLSVFDAAHGIESLFEDVEKEFPWLEDALSIIDIVHNRYAHSPKRKRKLRRTASVFNQLYVALKRIVETRYIKYAVVAGDSLISMFRIVVTVLQDDIANASGDDAKAVGILRKKLLNLNGIPNLMAALDVLEHAVSFSCCAQGVKFSVFEYLNRRRRFISIIQIFAEDGFNVALKKPHTDNLLSPRLAKFEEQIRKLEISGVKLGLQARSRISRSRSNFESTGDQIFEKCIKNQQSLAKSILKFINRLPESQLWLSMEIVVHPALILLANEYDANYYRSHLKSICEALDCKSIIASVCVQHGEFVKLLENTDLQQKHANYWKSGDRWDPLGVIESLMNPVSELADGLEDLCFIFAKIGLIRFTQADTERVVKTIRKTETRFAGYDEIKEQDGKRDRAMEEIFLRENRVPLRELPLEDFNQEWLKSHRPALKKNSKKDVAIETFFKNDIAKQQFWTA